MTGCWVPVCDDDGSLLLPRLGRVVGVGGSPKTVPIQVLQSPCERERFLVGCFSFVVVFVAFFTMRFYTEGVVSDLLAGRKTLEAHKI